eukprot:TRINITY_DN243_c5_g1_i1.p1 TRINITY_DN243_c5_g1~~TRINITY_DN243_c5_g1_i1.p1  ORF type:complete len:900 (+),score=202.29 TRINITY_DN243_c5_g1_i1:70-2700(+)
MDCMRPSASLQVVWEGLGHKKQTALVAPAGGTAVYDQEWELQRVAPSVLDESQQKLSIGLWLYNPGEDAQYVGSGLVDISDFHVNLEQNRKFEMAVTFMEEKVELTFTLSTSPQDNVENSSDTLPQQEPGKVTPPVPEVAEVAEPEPEPEPEPTQQPEPEPQTVPPQEEQPTPAAAIAEPESKKPVDASPAVQSSPQSSGTSPPRYNPDPHISSAELRSWVFAVLSEVRDGLTGEDRSGDGGIEISKEPTAFDKTITLLLDGLHSGNENLPIPAQPVEERLLSSTIEVYMRASENGPKLARQIREQTGDQLLSLLSLPRGMQRRVYQENGALTTDVLHQIQRFGLEKNHTPQKVVCYVNDSTYSEWQDSNIAEQLKWETPMLILKQVQSGDQGTMNLMKLEQQIREDISSGLTPAGVVGRMGSFGYAGMDDFEALSALANTFKLWIHVDGPAVFLLSAPPTYKCCEPITRIISSPGDLNISVAFSEDEMPGFRKLPGFWIFSLGPQGGKPHPSYETEACLSSIPAFLPTYLRLRHCGIKAATEYVHQRQFEMEGIRSALRTINEASATGATPNSITAKLHTSKDNIWTVGFTLLPHDHPLVLNDIDAVSEEQLSSHDVTLSRINSINQAVYGLMDDETAFTLVEDRGLVQWSAGITRNTCTAENVQQFLKLALGVGQCMFGVSKYAELVETALTGIGSLVLESREMIQETDLCTIRIMPPFYEHRGDSMDADDIRDLNEINSHLLQKLSAKAEPTGLKFSLLPSDYLSRITISLLGSGITKEHVTSLKSLVEETIKDLLANDPTILRIESEVIQNGIAIAEKKLAEANEQSNEGVLQNIPIVGGMFSWFAPAPAAPKEGGLKFDLNSTELHIGNGK